MSAANVGNSLVATLASSYTRGFTPEKSRTCAASVGKPTAGAPIWFGTRKSTVEEGLMIAAVLVALWLHLLNLFSTRTFTLEKGLTDKENVLSP